MTHIQFRSGFTMSDVKPECKKVVRKLWEMVWIHVNRVQLDMDKFVEGYLK